MRQDAIAEASTYTYAPSTRGGIGKFYLGREIAQVMGHRGAGWLDRASRLQEERPDLLLAALPIQPGYTVADIGAGTGYFAFPLAEKVPDGRVLAVDIEPKMLAIIEKKKRLTTSGSNVEPVLGTITNPKLPNGAVDLILIVDAYHEFSHPAEMGTAMVHALKPGGRLVLVEYRAEDAAVPIKRLHKMSKAQATKEMAALGLTLEQARPELPWQHVLIFRKAK